jgi:hypothetical protein
VKNIARALRKDPPALERRPRTSPRKRGAADDARPGGGRLLDALVEGLTDPEALLLLGEAAPSVRARLLAERPALLNLGYLAANNLPRLFDACLCRGLRPTEDMLARAVRSGSFRVARRVVAELRLGFAKTLELLGVRKEYGYADPPRAGEEPRLFIWVLGFRPEPVVRLYDSAKTTTAEEERTELFAHFARWGGAVCDWLAETFADDDRAFLLLAARALRLRDAAPLRRLLARCRATREAVISVCMCEAEWASPEAFGWLMSRYAIDDEDFRLGGAAFLEGICRGGRIDLLKQAVESSECVSRGLGRARSSVCFQAIVEGSSLPLLQYLIRRFALSVLDLAPGLAKSACIRDPAIQRWAAETFGRPLG